MAALPPLAKIAGSHAGIYEAYFLQADPSGSGSVGALDAAKFMKKSGLNDTVLSKVWDLSDPTGKGYLEKPGFYSALKYISLVQNGQEMIPSALVNETPPPNLGPVEPVAPPAAGADQWDIKPAEKANYDKVFDSLQPVTGLLSGDKVKPVLLNSKLPMDLLGKIWDLSDCDKDGYLDRDEFAVAMSLVYRARENNPLPPTLPPTMIPPSKRGKAPTLPGAIPVLPPTAVPVLPGVAGIPGAPVPGVAVPPASQPGTGAWVVSAAEKIKTDAMFRNLDTDMDGLVSGVEIRDIFVQSGLNNVVLAHIWSLCDMGGVGKLNAEQFALAMHLVQQKIKGIEPPTQLTPEMIPPSARPKGGADPAAFGVMDGTNAGPYSHVADFSAIKELDSITKEIDDIKKDKMQVERDKAQKEADIKIRQGEVQMQQKEFDAMTSTLHQLEHQKKEAQKRLDELDDKKSNLEINVKDMREKCDAEQGEVAKLKNQLSQQERSIKGQEEELSNLKIELNRLRDEEVRLEQTVESSRQQLESLVKSNTDLQIQLKQTKAKVQHLQDQHRALSGSIGGYTSQLNGGDTLSGFSSDIDTLSSRATAGSPVSTISNFSTSGLDDFKEDPFKGKDPFNNSVEQSDPFQNEDPFKGSDPFKSEQFTADPFGSDDPFKNTGFNTVQQNDPFGSSDPFGSAFPSSPAKKKPTDIDGFGGGFGMSPTASKKPSQKLGDRFHNDPFASQSHPKRNESPIPALPPKQKKMPPPRPAPPKGRSPAASPMKPKVDPFPGFGSDPFAGNDPFASSTEGGKSDGFANFAEFSPSKFDVNDAWSGTSPSKTNSTVSQQLNFTSSTENEETEA